VVVALLCTLSMAACGLPDGTTPLELDPTDVPYHLLSPSDGGTVAQPPSARTTTPDIFLLTREDRLVPQAAPLPPDGLEPVLKGVLLRLSGGPSPTERALGLATALGADARLSLLGVHDGTAVVDLDLGEQDPSASRLPLAIGQVVLSVTSVDGVDRVQLVRGGSAIEIPLPDGALTLAPVTAADYGPLLATPATPSPKARPT
jgi:hypothetical protein